MAKDIVALEPWESECPWCGKLVLVEHQLAVYEDGEYEQFLGLGKDERIVRRRKVQTPKLKGTRSIAEIRRAVRKVRE